jgi:hypothetical protein
LDELYLLHTILSVLGGVILVKLLFEVFPGRLSGISTWASPLDNFGLVDFFLRSGLLVCEWQSVKANSSCTSRTWAGLLDCALDPDSCSLMTALAVTSE